jgi:hypothetical protein
MLLSKCQWWSSDAEHFPALIEAPRTFLLQEIIANIQLHFSWFSWGYLDKFALIVTTIGSCIPYINDWMGTRNEVTTWKLDELRTDNLQNELSPFLDDLLAAIEAEMVMVKDRGTRHTALSTVHEEKFMQSDSPAHGFDVAEQQKTNAAETLLESARSRNGLGRFESDVILDYLQSPTGPNVGNSNRHPSDLHHRVPINSRHPLVRSTLHNNGSNEHQTINTDQAISDCLDTQANAVLVQQSGSQVPSDADHLRHKKNKASGIVKSNHLDALSPKQKSTHYNARQDCDAVQCPVLGMSESSGTTGTKVTNDISISMTVQDRPRSFDTPAALIRPAVTEQSPVNGALHRNTVPFADQLANSGEYQISLTGENASEENQHTVSNCGDVHASDESPVHVEDATCAVPAGKPHEPDPTTHSMLLEHTEDRRIIQAVDDKKVSLPISHSTKNETFPEMPEDDTVRKVLDRPNTSSKRKRSEEPQAASDRRHVYRIN